MDANFVIMGLPASGKTTFLAALWHLVEADEAECRLKLDSYRGDLSYLNRISEAWRTFRRVPRTSQSGDAEVAIHLVDSESGLSGTAVFPDIAGETFDLQIEERRCRREFVEEVDDDDGILFFVSADVKGDTLSIVELSERLPVGGSTIGTGRAGQASAPEESGAIEPDYPTEWEPQLLPEQVRIVQLLSDLLHPPFAPRRRRLVVLISAWDLVRDMGLEPRQWLAVHMPLVDQFLLANVGSFESRMYGVSAQGISLEDEAAVNDAAKLTPSRRVLIVGPEGEGHDLTTPLVWLMSANE